MSNENLSFDLAKAKALRKAFNKAVEDRATEFQFEGHTLLTKYAYYLLEYLANKGLKA